jgi:glycosyltransferase involved in cell wall biosynthesis
MAADEGRFPKILFVNEFAPDDLGVADLVRQLLLGYPRERIAWWYSRRSRGTRGLKDLQAASLHRFPLSNRLIPGTRFNGLKCSVLEYLWAPAAALHLRSTIRKVQPEIVWILLYSWPIMVSHYARVSRLAKVHTSLWDMPDIQRQKMLLGTPRVERIKRAMYSQIRNSFSCDGISQAVIEEIQTESGRKDCILVHSGFEPNHLEALEKAPASTGESILRLAYVGTIISDKAFFAMLASLNKIRAERPGQLILEFYGARGYARSSWFDSSWMVEHPAFSDEGLVQSLQRCSWGIVVLDPAGEDLRYSQFSFPNKIGTYLSAGVPILGIGHERSTLGRILHQFPVGRFTNSAGGAPMEQFLRELLNLPDPRKAFRQAILECARTDFDARQIRKRLWQSW